MRSSLLRRWNFIQPQPGKIPNYGQASTLQTLPVGQPQAPLLLQLQRLAEIKELRQQQQEIETALTQIPSWSELAGAMKGQITFNGSAQTGINTNFNLNSPQINWASISFDNILASGSYRQNELKFQNLSLSSNGGDIAFQGKLGPYNDGQLTITKLPLGEFSQLLAPTLPIEGNLDAKASLTGSFDNPNFTGQVALSDTTINQSQIQTAQAQFDFKQARLQLAGFIDLNNPDPVRFEGNIPYSFPFMGIKPSSDDLSVKLQVKNEGLALLNLFTDQLTWVDGSGGGRCRHLRHLNSP